MRRVGNLFGKIVNHQNLLLSIKLALRGKRFKRAPAMFYFLLEDEILLIQQRLLSGQYNPLPYKTFEIREPKIRKICAADFRDRVVHHAICHVLDPIFERRLIFDTYACRVGKGTHRAVKRLQMFSRKYSYFLKCDIQKYFESIDHAILKKLLRRITKDKRLLLLLDQIIDHPVSGNPPGKGLPIGNLTSQHFANLYLGELDHFIKEKLIIRGYLRYMDDFILFSQDKRYLHCLLEKIKNYLDQKLRLVLKESVVRIAPVTEGIPFLGFRVYPKTIRLQRANLVRWRKKLKKKQKSFENGEISEEDLTASIRSMIAHMDHANTTHLRNKELERCHSWA